MLKRVTTGFTFMPNIQSAAKRARQNIKRREANRFYRARARNAVQEARFSIEEGEENTDEAIKAATVALDKAAQRKAIHLNQASRTKSRLVKHWNSKRMES